MLEYKLSPSDFTFLTISTIYFINLSNKKKFLNIELRSTKWKNFH